MGFTTKTDQEINQVIQTLSKEFTGTTDHSTLSCIYPPMTHNDSNHRHLCFRPQGYKCVDILPRVMEFIEG